MKPETSPVKLVTAAYLEQSLQAEENAAADTAPLPTTASSLSAVWTVVKLLPGVVLVVAVLSLGINAYTVSAKEYAKEKDRRKCGVDWLLWASGSNKTFESVLIDKLEASRMEFERQQEEANAKRKPFELKEFDIKQLQWNPAPFNQGNSPFARRK